MKECSIGIIGAGGFGLALGNILNKKHNITIWVHSENNYNELRENNKSTHYLKGISLDKDITFTMSIDEAIKGKEIIIMATPSFAFKHTLEKINPVIEENQTLIIATKGLEKSTCKTMSEISYSIIKKNIHVLTLSGPSHAEELAKGVPTALVIAGREDISEHIRNMLIITPHLRVYNSHDQIGVEIGGALKNIIAIASGILEGSGLGDNTKAALMTRGLAEIVRFALHKGAEEKTLYGLSGVGDLIVTCASKLSRNNRLGYSLASGKTYEEIKEENYGQVAEGAYAALAVHEYAIEHNIDMPITQTVYDIIFNKANIKDAVISLMSREAKSEIV